MGGEEAELKRGLWVCVFENRAQQLVLQRLRQGMGSKRTAVAARPRGREGNVAPPSPTLLTVETVLTDRG